MSRFTRINPYPFYVLYQAKTDEDVGPQDKEKENTQGKGQDDYGEIDPDQVEKITHLKRYKDTKVTIVIFVCECVDIERIVWPVRRFTPAW